jgi:hypothetical protein
VTAYNSSRPSPCLDGSTPRAQPRRARRSTAYDFALHGSCSHFASGYFNHNPLLLPADPCLVPQGNRADDMKLLLSSIAAAAMVSGCVTPRDVADHRDIELKKAVFDVADSLHSVRDAYANRKKIGLGVQSATVVFNISSKATDEGVLKLEAAAGESVGFPLSSLFQRTLTNEGSRGNTITIVFAPVAGGAPKKPSVDGKAGTTPGSGAGSNSGTSTGGVVIFSGGLDATTAKKVDEILGQLKSLKVEPAPPK